MFNCFVLLYWFMYRASRERSGFWFISLKYIYLQLLCTERFIVFYRGINLKFSFAEIWRGFYWFKETILYLLTIDYVQVVPILTIFKLLLHNVLESKLSSFELRNYTYRLNQARSGELDAIVTNNHFLIFSFPQRHCAPFDTTFNHSL